MRAIRRHAPAAAIFALVALLFTYPTLVHPTQSIGGQVDARENYWNLWWTYRAVVELHHNPFDAFVMHHPFGLSLYFHTYNIVNGLLSLPFQLCCGTAFAYNVVNVGAFCVAALGMYALAWHLTRRRAAALVAGLIYAFSPYTAFHLDVGQTNLIAVGWLPWYLLPLWIGMRGRPRWLLVAALMLAVNALTDWHYVIFALVITAVLGLAEAVRLRRPRAIVALASKLALVGAGFALLVLPLLIPMVAELRRDPSARRPITDSVLHSTDLVAFLLPSPLHPLWGGWATAIFYGRLVPPYIVGGIASFGVGSLLLALVALVRRAKDAAAFAALFCVAGVLALGPYLQVAGVNTSKTAHPIPLPFLVFRELPFMDVLRIPSRFVLVMMLALAVLAALGLAQLWERYALAARAPLLRAGVTALLACLVLFEAWPRPLRTTPIGPAEVSPFYVQLGADPADYAIADVPYQEAVSMFYQTYHQKRTLGGRIARPKQHPWLNARFFGPLLQALPPRPEIGADDSAQAWRAALQCQGLRYVVLYKRAPDPTRQAELDQLAQALVSDLTPAYEDATLRAYGPLAERASEAYWTPAAGEWYPTETNAVGVNYRWAIGAEAHFLAYPCGSAEVVLRLSGFTYAQQRTVDIQLNGQTIQSVTLPVDQVVPVEIPITLDAGENRITLRSREPAAVPADNGTPNDVRQLSFNISNVSLHNR